MKILFLALFLVASAPATYASGDTCNGKQIDELYDWNDCLMDQYSKSVVVENAVTETEVKGFHCNRNDYSSSYLLPGIADRIVIKLNCGGRTLKVISKANGNYHHPQFVLEKVIFN